MVAKFRLGGLYWRNCMGYVECTRKTEDIAELTDLRGGEKALAYDGDTEYEDARSGVLERHTKVVQDKVWKLKHDLKDEETYLGKLKEAWPNVVEPTIPSRPRLTLGEHKPGEEME